MDYWFVANPSRPKSVFVDFDLRDITLRQLSCDRSVRALSHCARLVISLLLRACNFKKRRLHNLGSANECLAGLVEGRQILRFRNAGFVLGRGACQEILDRLRRIEARLLQLSGLS
jgi:hypothetical protein